MITLKSSRIGVIVLWIVMTIGLIGCQNTETIAQTDAQAMEQSDEYQKIIQLNQQADEMYKLTSGTLDQERIVQVRSNLKQFGEALLNIRFTGITSAEGVSALYDSALTAERVLNQVNFSQQNAIVSLARVRLATDALTHPNQPMWLQYDKLIKEDLLRLEQSADSVNWVQAMTDFNQLKLHYSIIKPSVLIQRQASEEEKVNSLLRFLETQLSQTNIMKRQVLNGINNLKMAMDTIFFKRDTTAYFPVINPGNPWVWSTLLASVIVSVLTFAAWQRYRYERNYVKVRKEKKGKVY